MLALTRGNLMLECSRPGLLAQVELAELIFHNQRIPAQNDLASRMTDQPGYVANPMPSSSTSPQPHLDDDVAHSDDGEGRGVLYHTWRILDVRS